MENTDKPAETAPVAPGAETSTETEAHVEHTILASEVQPTTLDEQNQALDETAAAVVDELALDPDQMEAMATEPTPVAVEAPKQTEETPEDLSQVKACSLENPDCESCQ